MRPSRRGWPSSTPAPGTLKEQRLEGGAHSLSLGVGNGDFSGSDFVYFFLLNATNTSITIGGNSNFLRSDNTGSITAVNATITLTLGGSFNNGAVGSIAAINNGAIYIQNLSSQSAFGNTVATSGMLASNNGQIIIIDKNTLRKPDYLNRSPDRADSLAIWNFIRSNSRIPSHDPIFQSSFSENPATARRLRSIESGNVDYDESNLNGWQAL